MIEIQPLVVVYHNCADDDEKQIIQKLAHDCALNLAHPIALYESGDARKILSPPAFDAFQEVMRSVYANRRRVEEALLEAKMEGWCVVCALPAPEKGEGLGGVTKKTVCTKDKGKRNVEERSKPRSPKYGSAGYPKFSRCAYLRRTRGVGVKIRTPSPSDEEEQVKDLKLLF